MLLHIENYETLNELRSDVAFIARKLKSTIIDSEIKIEVDEKALTISVSREDEENSES